MPNKCHNSGMRLCYKSGKQGNAQLDNATSLAQFSQKRSGASRPFHRRRVFRFRLDRNGRQHFNFPQSVWISASVPMSFTPAPSIALTTLALNMLLMASSTQASRQAPSRWRQDRRVAQRFALACLLTAHLMDGSFPGKSYPTGPQRKVRPRPISVEHHFGTERHRSAANGCHNGRVGAKVRLRGDDGIVFSLLSASAGFVHAASDVVTAKRQCASNHPRATNGAPRHTVDPSGAISSVTRPAKVDRPACREGNEMNADQSADAGCGSPRTAQPLISNAACGPSRPSST